MTSRPLAGGPTEGDPDEPIDAVYTWVDGDDPDYRRALRRYLGSSDREHLPSSLSRTRFQQHDELRYSLRSLAAYAPWIRTVFLVTNGQRPGWLDTACDRLRLVTHDEIFPDPGHLPTFSNYAIQLHLHRIAGLSRRFLYFNDDFLLGRPTSRQDFLTPDGGQTLHVERYLAYNNPESDEPIGLAETRSQTILADLGAPPRPRARVAHVPILYDAQVIEELKALAPAAFELASASRLRSQDSLSLRLLYSHYLMELSGQGDRHRLVALRTPTRAYTFTGISSRPRTNWRRLLSVTLRRPKFICMNDGLDPPNRLASWQLKQYFRLNFPRPSAFEISSP